MEDQNDIVQEILRDREKGTARLVAEYRDRLYAAAYSLCRDAHEAEDLVFCTFERAVAKLASYEERDSFFEWMHVILLNIYRNSVRGKIARSTVPVGGQEELDTLAAPQDVDSVVYAVDSRLVRALIEKMPDNMREVLLLRYFLGMSVPQIAKFLVMPVGTIKSRLHYARIALGQRFGVNLKRAALTLAAMALLFAASAAVWLGHSGMAETTEVTDGTEDVFDDSVLSVPPIPFVPPVLSVPLVPSAPLTPQGETTEMKTRNAAGAALTAAAVLAVGPVASARADGYQFIISGDPDAMSAEGSSSASSAASALTGGPLAGGTVYASSLEGRYRTVAGSPARALRSDKFKAINISFR